MQPLRIRLPRIASVGRVGVATLVTISVTATIVFAARTTPPVTTPEIRTAPVDPGGPLRDLARFDRGARIRVSSWNMHRRHHPLFAIDGALSPSPAEAWSPAPGDDAPWAEVLLARPSRVREIMLSFAPTAPSSGSHVAPAHTLRCMSDGRVREVLRAAPSRQAVVTHRAGEVCDGVDRVRLELEARGAAVSVYEIEVRGS